MRDLARVWNAMPKVVFSSTLDRVEWNSRVVRGDVGEELARLGREFDGDLDVSGPTLAASFIRRGLVDEYRLLSGRRGRRHRDEPAGQPQQHDRGAARRLRDGGSRGAGRAGTRNGRTLPRSVSAALPGSG
jgi:hypothetical protein